MKNLIKRMFASEFVASQSTPELEIEIQPEPVSEIITEIQEIRPLPKTNYNELDSDYLEFAPEAVGYDNREQQFGVYSAVANLIGSEDTILDFGCGRGDFYAWYVQAFETIPQYTGIDMSEPLINAGKRVYPDAELIHADWFDSDKFQEADWCINIGSLNLRYDGDIITSNTEYLTKTLDVMYNKARKGVIVLLASDIVNITADELELGIIAHNAGEVLNMALKQFTPKGGFVALDHSYANGLFNLIIYK
jgi:SAM-dependent methyltransferase